MSNKVNFKTFINEVRLTEEELDELMENASSYEELKSLINAEIGKPANEIKKKIKELSKKAAAKLKAWAIETLPVVRANGYRDQIFVKIINNPDAVAFQLMLKALGIDDSKSQEEKQAASIADKMTDKLDAAFADFKL